MDGLQVALDIPDLWQQDATRALKEGADVVVDAPTGAGKTRIFELFIDGGGMRNGQAVYSVPTRALANDKWTEWQARGWNVGIATGDLAENIHAPVLVATLETQRERILSGNAPAMLVVDEYQMIADPKRGLNYELAIALSPPATQLLLFSGSVRNAADIAAWLEKLGRTPKLVRVTERPVPLEDFPIEKLPRVPDSVRGFWPRLAVGAILARLSPLLIFAPRRADAEKIARKIGEALPPDDPIPLDPSQEQLLGRDLARLIQRRVAYHHSGLSYAARAGWIEPMAKNGHLRVIVATTGLAAGINFSVRSVLVSDTSYMDGPFLRELRPDELLQMFGRAGRRGLDDCGHVLVAQDTPRLYDAAPRQVRRINQIDWPTLLRVMEEATAHGGDPFKRAAEVCERLFSRQLIPLGIETHSEETEAPSLYGPSRDEFLNSKSEWESARNLQTADRPLSECLVRHQDRWRPALRSAALAERFGPGRLCKLPGGDGFRYGKELTVGNRREPAEIEPAGWVRKRLRLEKTDRFTEAEILESVIPLLGDALKGGTPAGLVTRGNTIALQLDLGSIRVRAVIDSHHRGLIDPPRRRIAVEADTTYAHAAGFAFNPPPGSAARAWRKLGLVDAAGAPTARGRVFSRFQAGEGLMIAAAIEDAHYPMEELVRHLANLRGGHRFADLASGGSERLAAVARAAYGHVDFEGYLHAGLCIGYGEGTWEAIERFQAAGIRSLGETEIRRGDVERAILEWQSLLRHIVHAPNTRADRWDELQQAAAAALGRHEARKLGDDSAQLPAIYRQRSAERRLRLGTSAY